MHFLLNGWTEQLQTLQMLWLAQKRVFAMVYHRLKSSLKLLTFFRKLARLNRNYQHYFMADVGNPFRRDQSH